MIDALPSCPVCNSILAPWEKARCSCKDARWSSSKEVLYAIACTTKQPLYTRDFVRLADTEHGLVIQQGTAAVSLSSDRRFCWAGQGLYGLYRHGPLPGARNLEQASRLLLATAGIPLTLGALDFILKRIGYRFNPASLYNAINRSRHISWRREDGQWEHPNGPDAELALRKAIPVVPPRQREQWNSLRARLQSQIASALTDRQKLLQDPRDLTRYGIDWDA